MTNQVLILKEILRPNSMDKINLEELGLLKDEKSKKNDSSQISDWQLKCTELKQRGAYLFQSGQWSDCTFLVGAEPYQVAISGHKLILAMSSPVFEAMFYGSMAEKNDPIPIVDVQIDAFKALLEYIYTGNTKISSFDKACELCYGAKKYMLPHLVKKCTDYLLSDLSPKNVCRAFEFATLFDENFLKDKCMQMICTNTKEVLSDSSFVEIELNTVITVFSFDHLNVDSELDLFEAAVRYAKALEKRNLKLNVTLPAEVGECQSPVPSTSKDQTLSLSNMEPQVVNDDNIPEDFEPCMTYEPEQPQVVPATIPQPDKPKYIEESNKKPPRTIRSAIEKVRFLTLTPQQFAAGPARSNLLTESEAFAVLMNILSSDSDIPMPSGFSTSRVVRQQLTGGETPRNDNSDISESPSEHSGSTVISSECEAGFAATLRRRGTNTRNAA